MTWKVPYIDLGAQYRALKPELDEAISRVMASGRYVNGEETERFEESMAHYLGVKHVIAVGNGYDALFLALHVLQVKACQSVITDSYTHISTHAAILNIGATPIRFTDRGINTVAHIPVHMNGRVNNLVAVPLPVIEDACQAIGAAFDGHKAGARGEMGCFSCHPMKVLSCAGDGGFVATSKDSHAERLRELRNHGDGKRYGMNSRLDNLQAAILNVKLPHLDEYIRRRREIAAIYHGQLPRQVKRPPPPNDGPYFDTYSSYVIGGSPEMLAHMRGKGIECFSHIRSDRLSLPIYPEMKEAHVSMVIAAMKSFYA